MELQNLPWYGQLAVFLLIGLILFGIFYFAYYSDNQARIEGITKQVEALEKEIRALEKKKGKIKEMQAEVEAKQAVLEKLKEILPEKKEISQILKKIQAIITTARLDIQKWTTMGERAKEIYVEHPFGITVDGNYHNLGMFFDQLSRLKKIFTVSNLSLKPRSKMNRSYTVKATFTALTYTFREK
ncbi:MAG: type 4a pilus biogenesis protein PilO, partial [bacterium]|nr:type 4a pilus biogenesis protein PilO [bacterium]